MIVIGLIAIRVMLKLQHKKGEPSLLYRLFVEDDAEDAIFYDKFKDREYDPIYFNTADYKIMNPITHDEGIKELAIYGEKTAQTEDERARFRAMQQNCAQSAAMRNFYAYTGYQQTQHRPAAYMQNCYGMMGGYFAYHRPQVYPQAAVPMPPQANSYYGNTMVQVQQQQLIQPAPAPPPTYGPRPVYTVVQPQPPVYQQPGVQPYPPRPTYVPVPQYAPYNNPRPAPYYAQPPPGQYMSPYPH